MGLIREELARIEEELAAFRTEADRLGAEIGKLSRSVSSQSKKLAALKKQRSTLTSQLKRSNAKIKKTDADIARNNEEIKRQLRIWLLRMNRPPRPRALTTAEKKAVTLAKQRKAAAAESAKLRNRLKPLPKQISAAQAALTRSRQVLAQHRKNLTAINAQINTHTARHTALSQTQARFKEIEAQFGAMPTADCPVALMPVGIETRFVRQGEAHQLLVRIYPDGLHLDSHEPELTDAERHWGKHFWELTWRAGSGNGEDAETERKRAWAQLAQRFGVYRAAWIARALSPRNPEEQPAEPVAAGVALPAGIRWPRPGTRAESWTRAPLAQLLPDRWVVMGYQNDKRVLFEISKPLPEKLAAGIDPTAEPPEDIPDDKLVVDSGMRWLVDFDDALAKGMALRMDITPAQAKAGFDTLLVLGLRASASASESAEALADLLQAQHYSDGLAFVPGGTPTNNTEEEPSGYSSSDPGFERSFKVERGDPLFGPGDESNGERTAGAFGIPAEIFHHVWHADKSAQTEIRAMHTALWSGTWGYFLEQIMADNFPMWAIRKGREHFIDFVRGQGALPTLRIGNQPYGILPVTALTHWKQSAASRFDTAVVSFLNDMRKLWRAGTAFVPRVGASDASGQSREQQVLNVLGMEATTVELFAKPAFDEVVFGSQAHSWIPPAEVKNRAQHIARARQMLKKHGLNWNPRLFSILLAEHEFALDANLVQEELSSGGAQLSRNYISWLRNADFTSIENETLPEEFPIPPDTLLYLLLRHSCLLEYANAAFRILLAEGVVSGWEEHADPTLVDILSTDLQSRTIGRYVDMQAPSLQTQPLRAYVHSLTAAEHSECRELDDLRSALRQLEGLSVAQLESLLAETLDVSAYRIDAWISSFATKKLNAMRDKQAKGIHIGAFGWVENLRPSAPGRSITPPPGENGEPLAEAANSGGFVHAPSLNQASMAAILRSGFLANSGNERGSPFAVDLSSQRVRLALSLLDGIRQGQSLSALLGYRFERGLHEQELDRYIAVFRKLAPLGEVYQAQVDQENAEAEVATLIATGHPELAVAKRAVTAAMNRERALIRERNRLAGQIRTAERKVARLDADIKKNEATLKTLKNIFVGGKPVRSPQVKQLEATLKSQRAERTRAQRDLNSLKGRRNKTNTDLAKTRKDKKTASEKVELLKLKDHPGLEAAKNKAESAATDYARLLTQHRERYLFSPATELQAMESVADLQAVDGLALHVRYQKAQQLDSAPVWDMRSIPFGDKKFGLPSTKSKDGRKLLAELKLLDGAIDAISDVMTAENVFQMVQGNSQRAGITLDSLLQDEATPPEPDVLRTPRQGIGLTHRLMVLFGDAPTKVAGWPEATDSARALAEPHLNSWAGQLLGKPEQTRGIVSYLAPDSQEVLTSQPFSLDALSLSPLDVVYLSRRAGPDEETDLEKLLSAHLHRHRPDNIPETCELRIDASAVEDADPDVRELGMTIEIANSLFQLFSRSRYAETGDFELPEDATSGEFDTTDLRRRADAAISALEDARKHLSNALAEPTSANMDVLLQAIENLARFGLEAAASATAIDYSAESTLRRQAEAILEEINLILENAARAEDELDRRRVSSARLVEHDIQRIQAVLGQEFRVLPRCKLENGNTLTASRAANETLLSGDKQALNRWMLQSARVRQGAGRLNHVLMYGKALQPEKSQSLDLMQLPVVPGDRWLGLETPPGQTQTAGRMSLVAHSHDAPDLSTPVAALFVDAWQEVIPSSSQTTGVAFHYDRPNSFPPQTILLAVPPDEREQWDLEILEAIALDTLDLLKLRSVDPDALEQVEELSQFLPALYYSLNLENDTVSTDFTRAARSQDG